MLPAPALDAEEARARCPQEADTLLQAFVQELSVRAERDIVDVPAVHKQLRLQIKLLAKPQKELEQKILAAGEQVDKEIRDCPKVLNEREQRIYDPHCVEAAEQLGRRRRVAAVDEYLSGIHRIWPEYLEETRSIVASANEGKWLIVLRATTNAAAITQTAAQFAR